MPDMPSNDDLKHQLDVASKAKANPVVNMRDDETEDKNQSLPAASNPEMHREFTFFQKNKGSNSELALESVPEVSFAQVSELVMRLDNAMKVNARTRRHISELMGLMSDIADELTPARAYSKQPKSRRSNGLFYGCLIVFGLGWLLLFPFGQDILTKIMNLLLK